MATPEQEAAAKAKEAEKAQAEAERKQAAADKAAEKAEAANPAGALADRVETASTWVTGPRRTELQAIAKELRKL